MRSDILSTSNWSQFVSYIGIFSSNFKVVIYDFTNVFCIVQREIRVGRTNDIFFAITKKKIFRKIVPQRYYVKIKSFIIYENTRAMFKLQNCIFLRSTRMVQTPTMHRWKRDFYACVLEFLLWSISVCSDGNFSTVFVWWKSLKYSFSRFN